MSCGKFFASYAGGQDSSSLQIDTYIMQTFTTFGAIFQTEARVKRNEGGL